LTYDILSTKRTVSTFARLVYELSSAAIEESTSMNQRIVNTIIPHCPRQKRYEKDLKIC